MLGLGGQGVVVARPMGDGVKECREI
jgi:hypothetical protein